MSVAKCNTPNAAENQRILSLRNIIKLSSHWRESVTLFFLPSIQFPWCVFFSVLCAIFLQFCPRSNRETGWHVNFGKENPPFSQVFVCHPSWSPFDELPSISCNPLPKNKSVNFTWTFLLLTIPKFRTCRIFRFVSKKISHGYSCWNYRSEQK